MTEFIRAPFNPEAPDPMREGLGHIGAADVERGLGAIPDPTDTTTQGNDAPVTAAVPTVATVPSNPSTPSSPEILETLKKEGFIRKLGDFTVNAALGSVE